MTDMPNIRSPQLYTTTQKTRKGVTWPQLEELDFILGGSRFERGVIRV